MSPMPPPGPGIGGLFFGSSATIASVVMSRPATDAGVHFHPLRDKKTKNAVESKTNAILSANENTVSNRLFDYMDHIVSLHTHTVIVFTAIVHHLIIERSMISLLLHSRSNEGE